MPAYLDLLNEAVGQLSSDGVLVACNDAMRRFLDSLGRASDSADGEPSCCLLDLPFDFHDRETLTEFLNSDLDRFESEFSLSHAGTETCVRLALQRDSDGGYWVVVENLTESRRWMARALRLERLRVIGALGEGLIHDLNNVMGSMMGLADYLAESPSDAESLGFLRTVVEGTRSRGRILKSIYRFIHDQKVARERVSMQGLANDIGDVFRKTALQAKIEFELSCADDLPDVRIVREHVMHVVFSVLVQVVEANTGPIVIEIDRTTIEQDGGPTRPYVVLRILDHGPDWPLEELKRWPLRESYAIEPAIESLLLAVAAVHVHGGMVEAGREPDGRRWISLSLPCLPPRA